MHGVQAAAEGDGIWRAIAGGGIDPQLEAIERGQRIGPALRQPADDQMDMVALELDVAEDDPLGVEADHEVALALFAARQDPDRRDVWVMVGAVGCVDIVEAEGDEFAVAVGTLIVDRRRIILEQKPHIERVAGEGLAELPAEWMVTIFRAGKRGGATLAEVRSVDPRISEAGVVQLREFSGGCLPALAG